ncbi:hypothetical protein PACTADRAFT_48181 [Pachysolen tannophilus NRRL Y-2460]|uniref:RRM domain-containing protein n=1 Tax=Pachysolen tannophilus NRRL Y-2460 TaxID=669874 RepID=A0A1E4U327_PACTA|nr:hypothetical protein PACTADRAFT_48181 [Pachysolen tannophilus NRRL Y-2460]
MAKSNKDSIDDVSASVSSSEVISEKKRNLDEIEIDLSQATPLSKKQKRLLRKGKLVTPEVTPVVALNEEKGKNDDAETESVKEKTEKKKSDYGIWIGNLSFDTTKEDLIRYLVAKTSQNPVYTTETNDKDMVKIEESDIVRVNLPKGKDGKIKGFSYVDFNTLNHVITAVGLSEQALNGRNLLIKDSNSFEGRPEPKASSFSASGKPPSRILFVGNLPFDTTRELLQEHFASCGKITKIRMATFEDTGKCKGFSFVDFKDETGSTAAIKNKVYHKLLGRTLRLEFGEDRSKRHPNHINKSQKLTTESVPNNDVESVVKQRSNIGRERNKPETFVENKFAKREHKNFHTDLAPNKRLKSSVALAGAQRQSAAIVESKGKKITFD